MIIVAIIALSFVCLGVLIPLVTAIFSFPDEAASMLTVALTYMAEGIAFIQQFFYWDIIQALISAVVIMDAAYVVYRVALWLLEKVPMFGIK